jgi:hypothetical protein
MENELDKQNLNLNLSTSQDYVEQISYYIWASVVSITKGFNKVEVVIEPRVNRIFIKIFLRWSIHFESFSILHRAWLRRAEESVKEYVPQGWKVMVYYGK